MKTRKSFKINGEMLGKASRFVAKNHYHRDTLQFIRIEKSNFFGAKIVASDGHKIIIFIDPASDFKGPDFNLGVYTSSRKDTSVRKLRPFFKACRKIRSEVKSKKGYVTIDHVRKKADIDGKNFNIICNSKEFFDYKTRLGKLKRIHNKKNIEAIKTRFFVDSRHAILSENKYQYGRPTSNYMHFINVSNESDKSSDPARFLLITSYSILLIMPMTRGRQRKSRELDSDSKILVSRKSLLEKVNLMLSVEDENAFTAAYKKKEFTTEFGNIFFDIK